jgi:hypothetical protein
VRGVIIYDEARREARIEKAISTSNDILDEQVIFSDISCMFLNMFFQNYFVLNTISLAHHTAHVCFLYLHTNSMSFHG